MEAVDAQESAIHTLTRAFDHSRYTASIAPNARIAATAYVGNFVTIYPQVRIADQCIIMDGAVLGRIPIANRSVTRKVQSEFSELVIGEGSIIGCGSVLYTGSAIGSRVLIGDLSSIREECVIGDDVVIGRGVMVLYCCKIGARSRIQDQAHLVGNLIIEEDVFIGMGVTTTNDNHVYASRFGDSPPNLAAPTFRRFCVIGAGATILPGVEIGMGAQVAAGAVVTHNVAPWSVVAGVPARHVREIPLEWRLKVEIQMAKNGDITG